uniref:Zinc finger protein 385C n=1 Tax=Erpetoichthys calabaricus TaxID=27687 RepID=A0A8C4TKB1_ERPCA
MQIKREKKQQTYTLCEVCNIQLNSPAQAQIHCNGKSHQKRLKQLNKGKPTSSPGKSSGPLLATLPIAGRPLQPQLDLKHFMPFRLNGSSPMSLFPNFNTMDPVQKAVINHTFGIPPPLKKKQIISCNICHLRFNSTNQAEAHYKGHKHARKLKAMEAQKNKQRNPNAGTSAGRGTHTNTPTHQAHTRANLESPIHLTCMSLDCGRKPTQTRGEHANSTQGGPGMRTQVPRSPNCEAAALPPAPLCRQFSWHYQSYSPLPTHIFGLRDINQAHGERDNPVWSKKSKQHLHCPACKVTVNSVSQLEAHNSGAKHKSVLEGQTSQPRRRSKVPSSRSLCKTKRIGNKGSLGVQSKAFHCEVCAIYVNSDTQLKQVWAGGQTRDHHRRTSVCPGLPIYCIIERLPCLSTKLALQKQLTKTLTPGFLPSPLSPAALCTMAASPLTLRHPAGTTTTLIQTPFLGPALFRPAPGPLRAAHTPILFAPY